MQLSTVAVSSFARCLQLFVVGAKHCLCKAAEHIRVEFMKVEVVENYASKRLDVYNLVQLGAQLAFVNVANMPPRPRKRPKTGAAGASALASGSHTPAPVSDVEHLADFQKACSVAVEFMYDLRRAKPSTLHLEERGPFKPVNGLFEWPVCHGGTFKEIAQRAWSDPDKLMSMSAKFASSIGLLDSEDPDEFVSQFCKLNVPSSHSICFEFLQCNSPFGLRVSLLIFLIYQVLYSFCRFHFFVVCSFMSSCLSIFI